VRPFRFAVQVSGASSGAAWRGLARRAEGLGYSTLFLPDHFTEQWAPLVALAAAAEATTTLNVGTLVLGNDYRHPVVLAKEAATLDLLSGGRLELGLGAGWLTSDYEQSGIALDPPAVRVERLGEAVAVLKALWRGGPADHQGAHYRLQGAVGTPEPRRRPHPTLLIGGGGRRVLSLAAREADIVGVNLRLTEGRIGNDTIATAAPRYYDERMAWVREAAGDRFDAIEIQCLTFVVQVVPNRRTVLEQLASTMHVGVDEVAETPLVLVGSVAEITESLQRRRERWAMSYVVVHEAELETFAPVVAALAGT